MTGTCLLMELSVQRGKANWLVLPRRRNQKPRLNRVKPRSSILDHNFFLRFLDRSLTNWIHGFHLRIQSIIVYSHFTPGNPWHVFFRARFCRAVTELQITGLLRMPSKRRPDLVQRIAFGPWDLHFKWRIDARNEQCTERLRKCFSCSL